MVTKIICERFYKSIHQNHGVITKHVIDLLLVGTLLDTPVQSNAILHNCSTAKSIFDVYNVFNDVCLVMLPLRC